MATRLPTGGQRSSSTVDKKSRRIDTGLQSSAIFNGIALVHIQPNARLSIKNFSVGVQLRDKNNTHVIANLISLKMSRYL
ncbi:hypothetical protein PXNS11_210070 [Stutzerimonas xanthomarina]|nr:hypothetical protein PXNS11_210070 [Stutzerimonas xanthomarina]